MAKGVWKAWAVFTCMSLVSIGELSAGAKDPLFVTRADNLPVDDFEHATDAYLEGYIQALVDMHYYECKLIVTVRDTRS